MEFFNKYKDLFGVPQGASLPSKKISINNSLFIDKPFIPTYTQSYNLNSKLKAFKKDYNDLESQIAEIQNISKRAVSRRGVQKSHQDSRISMSVKQKKQANYEDNMINKPKQSDIFSGKRVKWLHDQQKNLNKHSQMDYIFSHKIKQEGPKIKNPYQSKIKAQNFIFGSDVNSPPRQNYKNDQYIQHGNRKNIKKNQENTARVQINQNKGRKSRIKMDNVHGIHSHNKNSGQYSGGTQDAIRRRQQAKKNIATRRQKLGFLLRTSW